MVKYFSNYNMKRNEAYFFLIATFILILSWVIFSVLHTAVSSTISSRLTMQISPITPSFDLQTIQMVKKRALVSPITDIPISIETDASSSAESLKTASESSQQLQ